MVCPGRQNQHGGPDFKGARIKLGDTLWVGDVELHLRTSDWYRHRHQHNPQYGRVVLHVVFIHDTGDRLPEYIPCLELQPHISGLLLQRYERLRESAEFVPCAYGARRVPSLIWSCWQERLLMERWERKTGGLEAWLVNSRYNWEEVFYWSLAQGFGASVNALPFLQLAQSLPFSLLMRYQHQPLLLEALLFGQAGMLETTFYHAYPRRLQEEYQFLQRKYQLKPLQQHQWNWLRVRPAAFPSLRIAAFAALLAKGPRLFSKILEAESIAVLEKLFYVQPSPYWETHYRFDQPVEKTGMPGKQLVHQVLINTVLPLLYLYGKQKRNTYYQEKALHFLSQLPAEDNRVISGWKNIGVVASCARASQALLQLKQGYCEEKRCLECAVGAALLRDGLKEE